ncbi:MAG: hypothetical protein KC435_07695 [Thermomicrobiales bacterium]|nr:hypothetical protein [Thermomicrobiales bacterium]
MTPQGGLPDERFTILQMVQDGTITPDEGARLLEAMDRFERTAAPPPPPKPVGPRSVRIKITNKSGNEDIDLVLPFGLVTTGLNLANKVAPGKVPDFTEVRRSVEEGFIGKLINIDNDGNHIEISVEER